MSSMETSEDSLVCKKAQKKRCKAGGNVCFTALYAFVC